MKSSNKKPPSIPTFDSPGSLVEKTRKLLKEDKRTLLEVYEQTGLPYFWLRSFAGGRVPSPSVNRVQFLYEQLSGRKLSV